MKMVPALRSAPDAKHQMMDPVFAHAASTHTGNPRPRWLSLLLLIEQEGFNVLVRPRFVGFRYLSRADSASTSAAASNLFFSFTSEGSTA